MANDQPRQQRVPLAVYVLAASVFLLGTTEFMIVGILPPIADDLDVSLPEAGLLISGFALGLGLGAPIMAVATLRVPRKAALLVASSVFLAGHVAAALAPGYSSLMVMRLVTALATGLFWVAAYVVVVRLAPPGAAARALAVMIGGLTLSNILGVPGGTWIGHEWGWRWTFWAIAAITVLTTVAIALLVPNRLDGHARPDIRHELAVFRGPRIWLALAGCAGFQTAMFAALSYFAPLLVEVARLDADRVPLVFVLFGVGSLIGVTLGGKVADRNLSASIYAGLTALAVAFGSLALLSGNAGGAVAGGVAIAVAGFSIAPALSARVFAAAGDAPTLAAAANMSAFNVGNMLGPWIGGTAIAAGWGLVAPVWIAAGVALLTLMVAVGASAFERRLATI